eukprot:12229100-Ditylum_brightwellii.AAC.1
MKGDYEKQICVEIANIKKEGSERLWSKKETRDNGELWEGDDGTNIKGGQKITADELHRAGITLAKHIDSLDKTHEIMVEISKATQANRKNGLTVSFICNIIDICQHAKEDAAPESIDHRQHPNPYENQYGDL